MGDDGPVTVDETSTPTQQPAAPTRRRGMPGNAKSMIISMVVVALAVLGWTALVPRVNKVDRPAVDVAGIAREVNIGQKWEVSFPRPVPQGWVPTNVLLAHYDSEPATWQAGYDLPDGTYIAVMQTRDPNQKWTGKRTNNGVAQGSVQIGGAQWSKYYSASNKQSTLVRAQPLNGLATVVTGTASWADLQTFAAAL